MQCAMATLQLEINSGTKHHMSKGQARQQERVRARLSLRRRESGQIPIRLLCCILSSRASNEKDEKIDTQKQLVKDDTKATLIANWNESLQEASERRSLKHKMEETRQELRLANKALTEIRRAQLLQLLQEEHKQYEAELNTMGLTFHRERL